MKIRAIILLSLVFVLTGCLNDLANNSEPAPVVSVQDRLGPSLVYLDISAYSYDQIQPWRQTDITRKIGVGCAISEYEVITPAWNLTDSMLVKAKVAGKNEYVPANVKLIDYETNLAIIELDKNSMPEPLVPVQFGQSFVKNATLDYYWLSGRGNVESGQAMMDRARVRKSTVSFSQLLNLLVTSTTSETASGHLYFHDNVPIGIACWRDETKEAGLIPSEVINRFLKDTRDGDYAGTAQVGFAGKALIDPAIRGYLKMPEQMSDGMLISTVYTLGTGSTELEPNDVILAIDGQTLDPYGQYQHQLYDKTSYHHLITSHEVGDIITFDLWRDGQQIQINVQAKKFTADDMLIPYYEYGVQPEFIVTGGFVFQKLTRQYLTNWGPDFQGRVMPHIVHYYRDLSFNPTEDRTDIVLLSYVLPAPINIGYKDLRQLVVSKFNGVEIKSISDILKAQQADPNAEYDVIEFEHDNPKVILPRAQLPTADAMISRNYGLQKLTNIRD